MSEEARHKTEAILRTSHIKSQDGYINCVRHVIKYPQRHTGKSGSPNNPITLLLAPQQEPSAHLHMPRAAEGDQWWGQGHCSQLWVWEHLCISRGKSMKGRQLSGAGKFRPATCVHVQQLGGDFRAQLPAPGDTGMQELATGPCVSEPSCQRDPPST